MQDCNFIISVLKNNMHQFRLPFMFGLMFQAMLTLASCKMTDDKDIYNNDPYGVIEAEELGGQPERLITCSRNEDCPEYAQALFWTAVDILSGASAETIELEGRDFGLTSDMTIAEMTEKLGPQLEDLIESDPPEYDFKDAEFKRGLSVMHKAHEAGNIYASNELGVLFMEQTEMQNLNLAEVYFKKSLANGDSMGAYNLARIAHIQKPNEHKPVLDFLMQASQGNQQDLKVMYMLGLEAFGNEEEKISAAKYLKDNNIDLSRLRDDFNGQFSLSELE